MESSIEENLIDEPWTVEGDVTEESAVDLLLPAQKFKADALAFDLSEKAPWILPRGTSFRVKPDLSFFDDALVLDSYRPRSPGTVVFAVLDFNGGVRVDFDRQRIVAEGLDESDGVAGSFVILETGGLGVGGAKTGNRRGTYQDGCANQ